MRALIRIVLARMLSTVPREIGTTSRLHCLIRIPDAGYRFFAARLYGSLITGTQFLYDLPASFWTTEVSSKEIGRSDFRGVIPPEAGAMATGICYRIGLTI